MVEVVVAPLDEPPRAVRAMSTWLSDEEQRRVSRLHFERDRRRFIVARAHLRALLAERLGARPEAVELVRGRNGKPELGPRFAPSGWRFNVSHSEEVALYALMRAGEVGVDVEAIRPSAEADAIAARFFSPRERAAYFAHAHEERAAAFFSCWTRKEAFVKARGDGVSAALEQLDLSLAPEGWRLESFCPLSGFIAAVASHPG